MVLTFLLLYYFNNKFIKTLNTFIDVDAKKISSYVVNKSIMDIGSFNSDKYLIKSDSGITYNINEINKYRSKLARVVQENFSKIEYGNFNDYPDYIQFDRKRYKYVRSGFLCEVNFNSINNLVILSNVGPTIPIKLTFLGDIGIYIDIKIKEYGINNVVVQLNAVVLISNQVSMPLNSSVQKIKIIEPISMDIVEGKIPNYYSNFS